MADVSSNDRKTKLVKLNKNGKVVKRRSRNPEEWHKQKQKRLRIAGLEYINANGKVVPPKKPGPDCNCRRKCYQRVPEDVRLKTFQGFYSMKTHDEQNAYLFGLMRQVDVKRKRVKTSSRRTCTFEYFVRVKGRETQNQYQTTALTTASQANFYQPQNNTHGMGIIVQSTSLARPVQPTAFIVVQTKSEPQPDATLAISDISYNQNADVIQEVVSKQEKKVKKERKKGPLVKQWRYSNIFHDEINGAALAAIKTRLGMYYAESDAARKKAKQARPPDMVQTNQIPQEQVRPTHTLTLYT
ncbi:PREDICTED: uncharacterized protein LOC106123494 isoform X3 [Papilio xuthus]|uniref:Uncharacterized protein LOC106123494 isoform X3 n=1 Tax=Papilio xuthus TaxID=66420 RepID=A0AAJ6ZM05_PAPXU|nr:PREDICTED: uncharacterized protein LOC106123494 isoform X3 [Papilio xuthus]